MEWIKLLESIAVSVGPYVDKFTVSVSLTAGYILARRFMSLCNSGNESKSDGTRKILKKLHYIEKELERMNEISNSNSYEDDIVGDSDEEEGEYKE